MKKLILILLFTLPLFAQDWITATIDTNTSITDGIYLGGSPNIHPIIVVVDTPWTDANLTFQIYSWGSSKYVDLIETDGTEVAVTVDSTKPNAYIIKPTLGWALTDSIKIRSGTAGTPVTQGDDRTLYIKRGIIE